MAARMPPLHQTRLGYRLAPDDSPAGATARAPPTCCGNGWRCPQLEVARLDAANDAPDNTAMRYRRNESVTVTTVDDGSFLVEPETQEIFYLDALAAGVWTALAATMTPAELQRQVAEAFPQTPRETIEADLATLLADMVERKLLEAES